MVGTLLYLRDLGLVQQQFAALDIHVNLADAAQAPRRRRGQVHWYAPDNTVTERQRGVIGQQQIANVGRQEGIDLAPGHSSGHIDLGREMNVHLQPARTG